VSFSKNFTDFYIRISVLFIRLIGWLKGGARKNKNKSDMFKAKILTDYFAQKYIPLIENLSQKEIAVENPETIWQFWDNPSGRTTPAIVKASIESVEEFKGSFEHKVLNNYTIENYSDLPGYILDKFNKKQMDYAHFSDLLRLNLLKNHGGIWMDATDYMTNFVPEHVVRQDFFVFLIGDLTGFPYSFVQNCFIRSKKCSFLCEAWYEICVKYWENEAKRFDYFQHQLMFKSLVSENPIAKKLFAEMPHISEDETHQLVGNKLFEKFDAKEWERIKKVSFFQKTTYRMPTSKVDFTDTYFAKLRKGEL
jgi:hypothetical protein